MPIVANISVLLQFTTISDNLCESLAIKVLKVSNSAHNRFMYTTCLIYCIDLKTICLTWFLVAHISNIFNKINIASSNIVTLLRQLNGPAIKIVLPLLNASKCTVPSARSSLSSYHWLLKRK